ncbi:hypothetical protein FJQ98_16460 [Lysinibacillus agricola]|uniref:THO complex subunitTHOC2 N-terminal domain-containing protein n=1 Tax=Lysinibacillus agricola TaxID=2590012 RepID=A0ABX7ALQ0_9BACI|nr:hypothetical protein FJQ98_16460 [Lysinibacillus agricola]
MIPGITISTIFTLHQLFIYSNFINLIVNFFRFFSLFSYSVMNFCVF